MRDRSAVTSPLSAYAQSITVEGALTNCEQEPITIPGEIQPHGMLLALAFDTLAVLQVSENIASFLGIAPSEVLGQSVERILGKQQMQLVADAVEQMRQDRQGDFEDADKPRSLGTIDLASTTVSQNAADLIQSNQDRVWQGLLYLGDDTIILELILEPPSEEGAQTANPAKSPQASPQAIVQQQVDRFSKAKDLATLLQQVVKTVIKLTGYSRVMVYQFSPDGSGTVTAEEKAPHLEDSFLGLRYPATDIPTQARKLYFRTASRVIPDVSYSPVSVVPERHPVTQKPLEMGQTTLRSPSTLHTEYLQNMGVKASITLPLIVEDRLWGLIACHHDQPKQVSFEVLSACELLSKVTSLELFRQQMLTEKRYLTNVRSIHNKIRQALTRLRYTQDISGILKRNQTELLALVRATGAAVALDDQLTLIGETPKASRVRALVGWLAKKRQDVYYTHSLSNVFAPFEAEQDCACGLLVISIFLARASYHVLWFRPELVQSVVWAGNPSKTATVDEEGALYLTPRQSFARWQESVHGQSLPWQSSEVNAAQELRSTLLLAALGSSQIALRQAANDAQIANRAKSQFLAKMSHELRTPLNAILGFTQLIHYHETLSPKQRDRLNIINRSGEHLLSLINDILETSRIEAGQLQLNESCFDLHQLIASVRDMLTLRATNKALLLNIVQDPQVPQYVWGDESKLKQIVINLVGNAIKFTEQGEVALSVACIPELDDEDAGTFCIRFEVSDTGLGIKAENLNTIFEPFKQTEVGRQAHDGTGLGLSISRQNARLMGGDIQVKSQVDSGSVFTCRVQLGLRTADDVETKHNRQVRRVVSLAAGQPRYRILVAEDVAENQQLLRSLLTTVGFDVRTAENGEEAVEIWRQWQPHCTWMDLYMPKMDGYEATQQIRAEQSVVSDEPPVIIAISASVMDNVYRGLVKSGFDDYVAKPLRVNEIFEKMAEHLGVRYQYADEKNASEPRESLALPTEPSRIAEVRSQLLAQPSEWTEQFYRAALGAREKQVRQLIAQLGDRSLARVLQTCLEQLRFDLLQQIAVPPSSVQSQP